MIDMFSDNGKISEKQLRRMMVLPVFASIMFVVPYVSANLFGDSILPGLLLFLALAGLFVLYIYGMGAWYEWSMGVTGKQGFISVLTQSGLVGRTLAFIQLARLVARLAFYILLATAMLKEAQVPVILKTGEEVYDNLLVALPLLLVGIYGANTGLEKQGRIHEMLFFLLFLPFIVMILFGLKEVDYQVFVPRADMPLGKMIGCAYLLLTFVLPMENYLYLCPALREQKGRKCIGVTVIGTIVIGILLTLLVFGIYGIHGAADNPMTTIAIMRYIRLPFGVLERFDILMLWFFVIGCFLLICETLYFAKHIIDRLWRRMTSVWSLVFLLVLAMGMVVALQTYENGLLTYICYGATLDIPLSIILPIMGMGINRFYKE